MRYHLTFIRMATILKQKRKKCWLGHEETGILVCCCESKMVQLLWKTAQWFLRKLKELLYDPTILLLGIYLEKAKTVIWRYMRPNVHRSTIYNIPSFYWAQGPVTVWGWTRVRSAAALTNCLGHVWPPSQHPGPPFGRVGGGEGGPWDGDTEGRDQSNPFRLPALIKGLD